MQWNPDCPGEPCECPGTEVGTPPPPEPVVEDVPVPSTPEGRRAEVLNRHGESCDMCRDYIETGSLMTRPLPLEQ